MTRKRFNSLAYKDLNEFIYGRSKYPVTCKNGLVIGGGLVLPEINFTLPSMSVNHETFTEVLRQYKDITEDICKRAMELSVPGFIVEIELLPPTTYNPEWGIEITKTVRNIMYEYESKYNLKSAMRITPVDIREDRECLHMWRGKHWESIIKTFEGSANEGADLLSIESIGGKSIHDDAIMFCDLKKSLFSLGILGVKDMSKLWNAIVEVAERTGTIPSGDTACGFANTAMILADKGYIPKLFASVVRVMSAVRSLVAFEEGAKGPHKDCGYEGVYIKAITGTPISMEGKASACAHLSHVGNIAAAVTDLWSNESVQNVKLLGGMAPTVSMEQLTYDCRLMNTALKKGKEYAVLMRDFLSDADSRLDPQAYVLRPNVALKIAKGFVKEESHFERIKKAGLLTISELRKAISDDKVIVSEREALWLDTMESQLDSIPDDEEKFITQMIDESKSDKFAPEKYDLLTEQTMF